MQFYNSKFNSTTVSGKEILLNSKELIQSVCFGKFLPPVDQNRYFN